MDYLTTDFPGLTFEQGALIVAIDPLASPVEAHEPARLDFRPAEAARSNPTAALASDHSHGQKLYPSLRRLKLMRIDVGVTAEHPDAAIDPLQLQNRVRQHLEEDEDVSFLEQWD